MSRELISAILSFVLIIVSGCGNPPNSSDGRANVELILLSFQNSNGEIISSIESDVSDLMDDKIFMRLQNTEKNIFPSISFPYPNINIKGYSVNYSGKCTLSSFESGLYYRLSSGVESEPLSLIVVKREGKYQSPLKDINSDNILSTTANINIWGIDDYGIKHETSGTLLITFIRK